MNSINSKLPLELWFMILKLVVSQPWEEKSFLPPPDDFRLLLGFQEASEELRALSKLMVETCLLSIRINSADVLKSFHTVTPLRSIKYVLSAYILIPLLIMN